MLTIGVPGWQAQGIGSDFQLAVEFPAAEGVDGILQLALFFEQGIHFLITHGFGKAVADLIEAVQQGLDLTQPVFNISAHVLVLIQLRFLWQVADMDTGLRAGFTFNVLVHAGHDAQQGGFSGTVQTEHADLGAGEERQGNIVKNSAFGWDNLAHLVHGIYVLRHYIAYPGVCS